MSTVTTRFAQFIGGHEGFRGPALFYPVGVPTIGYNFTWKSRVFRERWMARYGRKLRRGDTMTSTEAHHVLLA